MVNFLHSKTGMVKLMTAATSGISDVFELQATKTFFGLQVNTSAGVTDGEVTIEGSFDGANWFPNALTTGPGILANNSYFNQNSLINFNYLRANITTPIVGGTVDVFVNATGS